MFSPIYFPLAHPPSSEVRAAERDIVDEEGYLTVRGAQYGREADAAQARRWEAERRVRNYDRFLRRKADAMVSRVATPLKYRPGSVDGCRE